jgi:hypothetical protein
LVGPTRHQGGVLVQVLISILWEGVYEGSLDAQTIGVFEGNKMIMPSTWLCLLEKVIRVALKSNVISRYHPQSSGE